MHLYNYIGKPNFGHLGQLQNLWELTTAIKKAAFKLPQASQQALVIRKGNHLHKYKIKSWKVSFLRGNELRLTRELSGLEINKKLASYLCQEVESWKNKLWDYKYPMLLQDHNSSKAHHTKEGEQAYYLQTQLD